MHSSKIQSLKDYLTIRTDTICTKLCQNIYNNLQTSYQSRTSIEEAMNKFYFHIWRLLKLSTWLSSLTTVAIKTVSITTVYLYSVGVLYSIVPVTAAAFLKLREDLYIWVHVVFYLEVNCSITWAAPFLLPWGIRFV